MQVHLNSEIGSRLNQTIDSEIFLRHAESRIPTASATPFRPFPSRPSRAQSAIGPDSYPHAATQRHFGMTFLQALLLRFQRAMYHFDPPHVIGFTENRIGAAPPESR